MMKVESFDSNLDVSRAQTLFPTLGALFVKLLLFVKMLQSSLDFLLQSLYLEPLIQNLGEYTLELEDGLLILPIVSSENYFTCASGKSKSWSVGRVIMPELCPIFPHRFWIP